MSKIPYGQLFLTKIQIDNVECWNFTDGSLHSIPTNTMIRLDNVHDKTHTTVCVMDFEGKPKALQLVCKDGVTQDGYRFIIDNKVLGKVIGIQMPKGTRDIVAEIMEYENGGMSAGDKIKLFAYLRKSGLGKKLQGHYSSKM